MLAFVPVYIKFLGIEQFGLIGVYISLLAIIPILDFGIGATLNRELARFSATKNGNNANIISLFKTLEIIYWVLGFVFIAVSVVLAPFISQHWFNTVTLNADSVLHSLIAMGLAITIQWMLTLYYGGLLGLQRQVALNCIIVVAVIVRNVGAVIVMWLIEPSTRAFFIWVAIVGFIQLIGIRYYLICMLPQSKESSIYSFKKNSKTCKFAFGITGISFVAFALTQSDKIVLSKMLSLEIFSYYSIAWILASGVYYISHPFYSTMFPKFTQLVKVNDIQSQISLYHKSSQSLAVILIPVAAFMAFYSFEIVKLWTGSILVAENIQFVLKFLVFGTTLNALLQIPYALQLAYGWTRLAFFLNLIGALCIFPVLVVAIELYSLAGAAFVWSFVNLIILFSALTIMHRKILKKEVKIWYFIDTGIPIAASIFVFSIGRFFEKFIPHVSSDKYYMLIYMILMLFLASIAAVLCAPYTRQSAIHYIKKFFV